MREMQSPTKAATTPRSMPTPRARRASSTSGRGRKSRRCSPPRNMRWSALHFGLDGAAQFRRAPLASAGRATPLACGRRASSACRCEAARRARRFGARASSSPRAKQRVRPARDEKVLTSWNALMVKGMARAGRVFGAPAWLAFRPPRARFHPRRRCWRGRRGCLATYKDGRAHLNAYLDDHAFLLDALLELMQTDFRAEDLTFARDDRRPPARALRGPRARRFLLREPRPREADPSRQDRARRRDALGQRRRGVRACSGSGHLVGEPRYLAAAERALELFHEAMQRNPSGHMSLVAALEEALAPPRIVDPARTRRSDAALASRARRAVPAGHAGRRHSRRTPPDLPPVLDKPSDANGARRVGVPGR